MENSFSNIWFWKEPDIKYKSDVLEYIKQQDPVNKDIIILDCKGDVNVEGSIPLMYYLFDICQQFKIFENEKCMFLNPKDFTEVTQLCLERLKSKENATEIEVHKEKIIECLKLYVEDLQTNADTGSESISHIKKFMSESNCIEVWQLLNKIKAYKSHNSEFSNHLSKLNFLLFGTIEMQILREVASILQNNDNCISSITIETPLNNSLQESPSDKSSADLFGEIQVTSELIKLDELSLVEEDIKMGSATKEYVEDIIISFLSLVVNSRNELALSKVMISPFIELSHEAFTHLKHLSVEKEMPMCQTSISYVTRLRLGGKGYAPPEDCPLIPHLKSFELFVDTLNQMQTIVEEDSKPKHAIKRLINMLKRKLIKCDSSKLRPTAIESAAEHLLSMVDKALELTKSKPAESAAPQVCQETLDILYLMINYIHCSTYVFDPEKILRRNQCKRTPINLPPLLGYFRSPEEQSVNESPIVEDDSISDSSTLGFPAPLMSYFHNSDNSCSASSICVKTETPTRTSFESIIYAEDSIQEIEFVEGRTSSLGTNKRSALGDITNERNVKKIKSIAKSIKSTPVKPKQAAVKSKNMNSKKSQNKEVKKTQLSKKFKQIEGQGKITNFFIMGKK